MSVFKTQVLFGPADGEFETAVYRFLELHADDVDDPTVAIHSEPTQGALRKSVTLWSEEAVAEFDRFWTRFQYEQARAPKSSPVGLVQEWR